MSTVAAQKVAQPEKKLPACEGTPPISLHFEYSMQIPSAEFNDLLLAHKEKNVH